MRAAQWKFGIALAVILAAFAWLAFTGIRDSKSYYVTIAQLQTLPQAHHRRLRVSGVVVPGSIQHTGAGVNFVLEAGNNRLPVTYVGTDPLPDTFVGKAKAIAAGHWLENGTFRATGVSAKCASHYEPKGVRASGKMPTTTAGTM